MVKKFLPHIIAVLLFVGLSVVYFSPVVLDGKELKQGDITNFKGMSKEIVDYRQQYHEEPLWTNSMFGGMPAYQISVIHHGNLMQYVDRAIRLFLPHPISIVFMYLLGFYILLIVLGIEPWLAILGAIAFAFSSYFFIILEAGHNSKALAIAYIPPTVAGFILVFRKKYLLGGAIAAFFLGLDLYANHPQITYYMFLFLLLYVTIESINAIREKDFIHIAKAAAVLGIAGLLAVGSDAGNLLSTYQYGQYTTRGKSELTNNKENKTGGLDRDYATQWSYGQGETMSLMIPDFKGGGSGAIGNEHRDALDVVDNQFKEYIGKSDQYFGDQPFTSGPVYAGAIVIFLFILGLFVVKGSLKQAILGATVLSILLAWGKNFMGFSNLFFDHFPGYNKFRAVSMILVIAEFTIPLLAVLAIDQFLKTKKTLDETISLPFIKKPLTGKLVFFIALGLTAGLSLLFYLMPGAFNTFFKANEQEQLFKQITQSGAPAGVAQSFLDNLQMARQSIFKADALRSFFLIIFAAAIIWLYFKTKIERKYIIMTLAFFVLVDLWSVDRRYVNNDNFVPEAAAKIPYAQTAADTKILEDHDPDFRVLNLSVSTFNDASTSYFHKSIGGYHGAKLKRYQELIDAQIDQNIATIEGALRNKPTDSTIQLALSSVNVLNMLNTRYLVYNPEAPPLLNKYAFGNAWFVNQLSLVPNADAELAALSTQNPRTTAIVDERFKTELAGYNYQPDPSAQIKLLAYKANELTYESNVSSEQLAVFSEIYFKDGWNAYVDGKLTPHFRADYVLRAMRIPAGKHHVVFKFEPTVYQTGERISMACSSLLLLLTFGAGAMTMRKPKQ